MEISPASNIAPFSFDRHLVFTLNASPLSYRLDLAKEWNPASAVGRTNKRQRDKTQTTFSQSRRIWVSKTVFLFDAEKKDQLRFNNKML
jgi:hypothetical protein